MNFRLFRRRRDEELNEELQSHLRMATAERITHGETPDEAHAAARREFGNVGLVKEVTRDIWGGREPLILPSAWPRRGRQLGGMPEKFRLVGPQMLQCRHLRRPASTPHAPPAGG